MNKRTSPFLPVGGSSLLVIFAILCLTTFSLLALSTAQAGTRLSHASADGVAGYYRADCLAEETLALLRAGRLPEGVIVSGDLYTYQHPISDTQLLDVALRREGDGFTILRWQAVPSASWQGEDDLPVWDGN